MIAFHHTRKAIITHHHIRKTDLHIVPSLQLPGYILHRHIAEYKTPLFPAGYFFHIRIGYGQHIVVQQRLFSRLRLVRPHP